MVQWTLERKVNYDIHYRRTGNTYWYDPKTKETVVETNYVHDINHYLRIIADGGMELLDHEVEGDRVISLRAKVLDGAYRLDRKVKKKRVVSDEMRERLRQQLQKARKS